MRPNIHALDKIIRIIFSVGLLWLMVRVSEDFFLEMICGMFGVYFILTALKGICPLYAFLHVSTKSSKKRGRY